LDVRLELVELRDDLLLRLVDQDAVVALVRSLPDAEKVRVVALEVSVLEVGQLPFALAEGVITLRVLLEQREGDLLPLYWFSRNVTRVMRA